MHDKYFLKKEKLANMLFDIVKYLLTALCAMLFISETRFSTLKLFIAALIAVIISIIAIFITPLKED
jgi:hypothetical protein